MKNRFVTIEYDETGDISSYTGIKVTLLDGEVLHEVFSGDVVKDFGEVATWIGETADETTRTVFTSSVDHFVMDIPGYRWIVDEHGREVIGAASPEETEEHMKELEALQEASPSA